MDIENKRTTKTDQIDFFQNKKEKKIRPDQIDNENKRMWNIATDQSFFNVNLSSKHLLLVKVLLFDQKWPIIQEKKIAETEY